MDDKFRGKVALITGSTNGIGLAAAHAFAKRGIHLIITGIASDEDIQKILTEIKKLVYLRIHLLNKKTT